MKPTDTLTRTPRSEADARRDVREQHIKALRELEEWLRAQAQRAQNRSGDLDAEKTAGIFLDESWSIKWLRELIESGATFVHDSRTTRWRLARIRSAMNRCPEGRQEWRDAVGEALREIGE